MRVGITLEFRNFPNNPQPWNELWEDCLSFLVEAEKLGFDSLLVQEHFFSEDGYGPSIPIFLTKLAERTSRARIGSYIYVAPLHHPLALAQETAVLDQLSGGRLDVGLGIGHRLAEYEAFGLNPRTRPSRMEECLELLKLGWSGEKFDFDGRYYKLRGTQIRPTPLQEPNPPIWVAATTIPAAERAGRHGAHLAAASVDPAVHTAYRQALEAYGHDSEKARVSNPWSITVTNENPDEVWARNREHYHFRWDYYRKIREEFGDPDLDYGLTPSPETYRQNELIGTADQVLAALEPHVTALSLTDLVVFGPAPGIDLRTEGLDCLRRFADEVLPVLKSW